MFFLQNKEDYQSIADLVSLGNIGVIPTDTVYGLVGSALIPQAIEKLFEIKGRDSHKPFIILISSIQEIAHFGCLLTEPQKEKIGKWWPGPVSIILDCPSEELTIQQAKDYFDNRVAVYLDEGEATVTEPSTIIKLQPSGDYTVLRGKSPLL